jgi:hypothetical protein
VLKTLDTLTFELQPRSEYTFRVGTLSTRVPNAVTIVRRVV